ncbi:MAG: 30S ribosomal protein S1 [Bacteroidetes bacterium RBG_13_46_8]|nr:MAG: 30S ribosomal protein S1 [Bacteroidetes bacterium RBG_13_46_8]
MTEHSEKNLDSQEDQNAGAVNENIEIAATGDTLSPETEETKEPVTAEEKQPETVTDSEPDVATKAKEKTGKTTKGRKTKAQAEDAEPSAPVDEQEFDWEKYEEGSNFYSKNERQRFEKLYGDTLSAVKVNEVVDGTVISMNKREVVVNIGYKSEGMVSLNEFRYNPELAIGDKVEVYVESQEDKKGQLVLSHKKARALKSWDRVNEALEKDEIIKGYIKCRTKGGMIVDVFGIEAFLPGSQIDVKPIRDYDIYVGKTMEFKVVKINHEFKNVVVSHKALIEAELEHQKKEIIAKLEKGQILEGTVKNITSYGVFIDLGGVDGLIHITDLSWGRINHPEEIVQLDQKLQVVILDFDDEKKRIALGLKQLTAHPWDSLDANLKVGDHVKGRVVVMADYGAFIEIAAGVEGLIHVSEMSWSQHLRSAQEFLKVGDEVEAVILTLDREERKMSLGMKQLKTDPWEKIEEKYPLNSKHSAKVRNFTNFGVFVEIEEGVDGLIHISDLSWTKKIKHPAEFTNIGDEIEVVVLEIDKENRRLSLGHKQLEENPWDVFESVFLPDSIHEGTIIEVTDKGAVVALQYGVEGFVTPKHLVKEDGTAAKIEEKLPFKVIEFSKSAKKVILSHSRVYEDEKRASESAERKSSSDATRKATRKIKSGLERTTLGDISELAALKTEMEKKESKKKKTKEEKTEKTEQTEQPEQTEQTEQTEN